MKKASFIFSMVLALMINADRAYSQMSPEDKMWMQIETFAGSNEKKIVLLNTFIKQYPQSSHINTARAYRDELQNAYAAAIYDKAMASNDPQLLKDAIVKYPSHKKSNLAKSRLNILDQKAWAKTNKSDSLSLRNYVDNFPGGLHSKDAIAGMKSFDAQINIPETPKAENVIDIQRMGVKTLQAFIVKNPNSPLISQAKGILVEKERFYVKSAIANKGNVENYRASISKLKELFPKSDKIPELEKDLLVQQNIYDKNKDKPDYAAWLKLNKTDLNELRNYNKQYPNNSFKGKIITFESKQEEILNNNAVKSNSLLEIDNYLKAFPQGKYSKNLKEIKTKLEDNSKYVEVKKLIDEGNKYKLSEFIKNNKTNPLSNTVAKTIEKKSDLFYLINLSDTGMIITILNYDRPSITVIDPDQDIVMDSTRLKSNGSIVVNFDVYSTNAYLIIKDSNGRERKIKIDRDLHASFSENDKKIELLIEGGIPPYNLDFYNLSVGYPEKTYIGINTNSKNKFTISRDSLNELSGEYKIIIKNNDNGQAVELAGLMFDNSSNRITYFTLLAAGVLILTFGVIRLYIKRSKKKTIFDEYE